LNFRFVQLAAVIERSGDRREDALQLKHGGETKGRTFRPPLAKLLYENDQQREDRQGLDKRETQDQQRLNTGTSSRIPRNRFRGARHGLALTETAQTRSDRHTDGGANEPEFTGADARTATLREHRTGSHKQEHRHEA
jgi:hypothetical protein